MMLVDTLTVIGLATVSLGTIHEADGPVERTFWLRNDSRDSIALLHGYTSCGCTTISFERARRLGPADRTPVTLRFNPRGKGGEFMETGTVEWEVATRAAKGQTPATASHASGTQARHRIQLSLTGNCITSEETLLQQFPIVVADGLRLSANRFDLGYLKRGEQRERTVVFLHRREGNRKERVVVRLRIDEKMSSGLHHLDYPVSTKVKGKIVKTTVRLDFIVR